MRKENDISILLEFRKDELSFRSNKSNQIHFTLDNKPIQIDFQELIDTQFSAGNVPNLLSKLKNFLNLENYMKAPCGGFFNFFRVKNTKNSNLIVYSGVKEIYHSIYEVNVHKILLAKN